MRSRLARMIRELPSEPGVYRFRNAEEAVLYIGRAANLRSRVASYWSDLHDRRHLMPMVAAIDQIEAVVCDSKHEATWLERNLLEVELPVWNRTPGGQEVPVYIKLDAGATAPGLQVVHTVQGTTSEVRFFGPYLGGLQVRRAVTGMHRIYPLAYAGSGVSGTERAMALERGVDMSQRGPFVGALTALLDRQAASVTRARAELEQARHRAVASEAFELAGRIQAELQGLDWITSTQRAAVSDVGDAEVHGWSAGVLVSFGMRNGRLCRWSRRRCDSAAAQPRLAVTPSGWTDFAQRNADLASRLLGCQAVVDTCRRDSV